MKNKRKSRWNYRLFLRNIIVLALLLFVGYSIYSNVVRGKTALLQVSYEEVPLKTAHRALLILNESVVTSHNSGLFTPQVVDGAIVDKGQIIGQLKIELLEDDAAAPETPAAPVIDEAALRAEIDVLYDELAQALRANNHILAKSLKGDLTMKLDRLKKLIEANSDSAYLDIQQVDMVGQADAAVGQVIDVEANRPGLVSYYFDGYESIINYQNLYKIDYDNLFSEQITPLNQHLQAIHVNQGIFKLVDTLSYYLACQIEPSEMASFDLDGEIAVAYRGQPHRARVYDVFQSGNGAVLIIKLNAYIENIHRQRSVDVELTREKVRGIKIPHSALLERGAEQGVLLADDDGALSYRPVKILAAEQDFVVVQEGVFQIEGADGQLVTQYSIRHGDEIVKDVANYKEGDIVE